MAYFACALSGRGIVSIAQCQCAAEALSSCQGFQGVHDMEEKMVDLWRTWDHMLHRLAEVEDDVERLQVEKFMRDFLPQLRAGVKAHASSHQLTEAIKRLCGTLAQELIRWNVMAMEPQKAPRPLHLPELQKISEDEIVASKLQGDLLGKGMFAVYKGWWHQQSASSSSLGSGSFPGIPVAVKTYEDDGDDDACGALEDHKDNELKLRKRFDCVERNAKRQLASAHNNAPHLWHVSSST
eukprot:6466492-Amphidinium_carterae.1